MTTARISRPLFAIFWMLMSGAAFVGVNALVKTLGPVLPATETAFLRYVLGLPLLLPVLGRLNLGRLTARQWRLFGMRGAVHCVGVALWFFAMARIPIADVTAINYLAPILTTIGAALFLGERLAIRRIMAVVAGLVGALIILRPGLREVEPGHLAMLGTSVCFAVSYLISKRLSDEAPPVLIVAMLSVTVSIGLAPMALPVWVTPSLGQIAVLFVVACLASSGHYFMMLAFREAPLTVTQPVTFLQLIWSVLLGVFLFGEGVDPFVLLGGAVIMGAVSYITWREAVMKRRHRTPPVVATKG